MEEGLHRSFKSTNTSKENQVYLFIDKNNSQIYEMHRGDFKYVREDITLATFNEYYTHIQKV